MDQIRDAALCNIKLLSTTRNGHAVQIQKNVLLKVDAILRDIDVQNHSPPLNDAEISCVSEKIVEPQSCLVEEANLIPMPQLSRPIAKIPFSYSIQYRSSEEVLTFLQRLVNEKKHYSLPSVQVECSHCNSKEVLQTQQLQRLAAWRKQQMATVNLHPSSSKDN
jgi:hypothetical protein